MSTEDPFSGGGGDSGAPAAPSDNSAPAPASHDERGGNLEDIDSLLAEFDAKAKSKAPANDPGAAEAPAVPRDAPIDTSGLSADELMRLELGAISNRAILQSVLDHQITQQEQQHQEYLQRQEKSDFEMVVGMASDHLEDLPVPEDFAKRYLAAEYQMNPELKQAWDHRRDSPEHDDYASRVIKRVFKQMRKSASRIPDLQATEDRAAVTAAVRGAGGRVPEAAAPNFDRMTDNEFAATKDRMFGK